MVCVSLQEFLRTGAFGPIHLGMSRTQVQDLLGSPDDIGGARWQQGLPGILKYGDIEFHYEPDEDRLMAIYSDGFDIPQGGSSIDLDPWIIRGGMPRSEVEQHLEAAGIRFEVQPWPLDDGTKRITAGAAVRLVFVERAEDEHERLGLYAISRSPSTL